MRLLLFALLAITLLANAQSQTDDIHYENALDAMMNGDFPSAINYFQQMTTSQRSKIFQHEHATYIHTNLATALSMVGENEEAINHLQLAISADASNADAHYYLGTIHQDAKNHDEAHLCYKRAISVDPLNWEAYANLGAAYHDLGNFPKAVDAFGEAVKLLEGEIEPTNPPDDINAVLSDVHFRIGSSILSYKAMTGDDNLCKVENSLEERYGYRAIERRRRYRLLVASLRSSSIRSTSLTSPTACPARPSRQTRSPAPSSITSRTPRPSTCSRR